MGQLWSTVEDLARWATFLAQGEEGVLAPATVRGDVVPAGHVLPRRVDPRLGARARALQPRRQDLRRPRRRHGRAPRRCVRQPEDTDRRGGAHELGYPRRRWTCSRSGWPSRRSSCGPSRSSRGTPSPSRRPRRARSSATGGRRAAEFVFTWEQATLRAKVAGTPPGRGETTFERDGDGWIAAAGRERGERLRVEGERLIWAGYAFTRRQAPFKA